MTTNRDPRPVALCTVFTEQGSSLSASLCLQYREEMALVFRDCCRTAYRERGVFGLVRCGVVHSWIWGRMRRESM